MQRVQPATESQPTRPPFDDMAGFFSEFSASSAGIESSGFSKSCMDAWEDMFADFDGSKRSSIVDERRQQGSRESVLLHVCFLGATADAARSIRPFLRSVVLHLSLKDFAAVPQT